MKVSPSSNAETGASLKMPLNRRAIAIVESLLGRAEEYRVIEHCIAGGARYIDCGIEACGGLLTGVELARICLGGLAQVSIVPGELGGKAIPLVQVVTDHPVRACLAAQYAGWALKEGKFFAMGSGPMRAAAGSEAIFDVIGFREPAEQVVGVLETRKPPPEAIVAKVAEACQVEPSAVTLLAAPTASLAGGLQIVARSVETALHKLAELKFDLTRIISARHGALAASRRERPGRHRADQRRNPLRSAGDPGCHRRRREPRSDWSRGAFVGLARSR